MVHRYHQEHRVHHGWLIVSYEDVKKFNARTLEATWWVLDSEEGMDDLYTKAGDTLAKMVEDLGIEIFRNLDGKETLFLARFEFPKYNEDFQFGDAVFAEDTDNVMGFIDFLAGVPIDCCEMLLAVGQHSTKAEKVTVKSADDTVVAPIPTAFFSWPDWNKVLFSLTALPVSNYAQFFATNLNGEDSPQNAHWWFRVNLAMYGFDSDGNRTTTKNKFPIPGEFLALGVKMMPDKPWGEQKSSPFLYAGNWMDTVYYTSVVVTKVIAPTDATFYPTYEVTWRKKTLTVKSSDFAEYKVNDRVTILKDVAATKKTQLWKDDDMDPDCAKKVWQMVPVTFYEITEEA